IEKALIDGIYLNIYSKRDVKELSKNIDWAKLVSLARRYKGRSRRRILEAVR
ncbi:hypothetical protein HYS54_04870, partial [Candidatus Micrarchaeota archaeon]|nr:hypothetical protein [Candidatus Micrarchaeota archaeon]